MRAWDDRQRTRPCGADVRLPPRRRAGDGRIGAAGAAVGYWWMRSNSEQPSIFAGVPGAIDHGSPSPSDETLAWLEPDPASLQVVRLRVASTALAAHGYAVSDPDGDGTR